ncbi:hypothetical protein AL1_18600 [Alistipes shahii WAL 8301]|uniref:Uncharacterized protein n=1 Tax=Alistipes shahii WAL 8301 TaxID=717959 RepID=D4IMR2_9BACT|nr:hypothetical protein AL1_18600 [Alistipes shahii WAL 8301]
MDDTIDMLILEKFINILKITNIHPNKLIIGFILHILQIG